MQHGCNYAAKYCPLPQSDLTFNVVPYFLHVLGISKLHFSVFKACNS